MRRALLFVGSLIGAINCTGKSNLEDQISAHGVYDETSKVDNAWLKASPKESVKIQSQKTLRIPMQEKIWNQTTGKWQSISLNIHGLLQLYVFTNEDEKVWSSCALETYLTTDSLMAAKLFVQGTAMSGLRAFKDHTSIRSEIAPLHLTDSPHAPELMKQCEKKIDSKTIKLISQTYQSLLITSWLEDSSFSCNDSRDCQVWGSRFPSNWGKGRISCRAGVYGAEMNSSENYCSITASSQASCPVYLTSKGLMGYPDGESSILVSDPNRSSLSCTSRGFICLITGKKPNGLFHSSCVPEIEKYISQTK